MRTSLIKLALLCTVAVPAAAHADVVFNFTGATLSDSTSVTGSITVNRSTGMIDSANFTAEGETFTGSGTPSALDELPFLYFPATVTFDATIGTDTFSLVFPDANLHDYIGGDLCNSTEGNCSSYFFEFGAASAPSYFQPDGGAENDLTAGTLVPATVITPEPSSLALLGTGMLAAMAAARRRLAAR